MAVQRNKSVLEGNLFTTGRQVLVVRGLPSPLLLLQRDAIPMEMSVIETADKRRFPGGRNSAGEFSAQIQLAHDDTRNAFLEWYEMCIDRNRGINPNYKRDGILTYDRLFQGSPASEFAGAGRQGQPFKLRLIGLWINRAEFPEFDMAGGDEGDSDAKCTVNFNFDDVEPERRGVVSQLGGFGR